MEEELEIASLPKQIQQQQRNLYQLLKYSLQDMVDADINSVQQFLLDFIIKNQIILLNNKELFYENIQDNKYQVIFATIPNKKIKLLTEQIFKESQQLKVKKGIYFAQNDHYTLIFYKEYLFMCIIHQSDQTFKNLMLQEFENYIFVSQLLKKKILHYLFNYIDINDDFTTLQLKKMMEYKYLAKQFQEIHETSDFNLKTIQQLLDTLVVQLDIKLVQIQEDVLLKDIKELCVKQRVELDIYKCPLYGWGVIINEIGNFVDKTAKQHTKEIWCYTNKSNQVVIQLLSNEIETELLIENEKYVIFIFPLKYNINIYNQGQFTIVDYHISCQYLTQQSSKIQNYQSYQQEHKSLKLFFENELNYNDFRKKLVDNTILVFQKIDVKIFYQIYYVLLHKILSQSYQKQNMQIFYPSQTNTFQLQYTQLFKKLTVNMYLFLDNVF